MIIKALTIENFKGIHEPVRVEFKPITLLFGPNSAGKSTIVQALHYVREILERNNVDADRTAGADESLDLGGFKNLIHKHDLNLPMRFKFELSYSSWADYSDFFTKRVDNAWLEFEIKWSNFLNAPLVSLSAVGLDGEHFGKIICDEAGKKARIVEINFKHHLISTSEIELESKKVDFPDLLSAIMTTIKKDFVFSDNKIELFIEEQTALPQSVRLNHELVDKEALEQDWEDRREYPEREYLSESTWETLNDFFHAYFGGLANDLRKELKKFRYIGPIRKTPPRVFAPLRTEDESRWTSGLAAWDVLYKANDEFIQKTNSWLTSENKLNSGYRIDVRKYKELDTASSIWISLTSPELLFDDDDAIEQIKRLPEKKRLFLRDETNGVEVLPQDVGIGISQVLPVIVVALHSDSGIVAIEQPELHIHPAFQVNLGDLFISQVKDRDVCFLLETHSEHLLLRFLRRIRETNNSELPPGLGFEAMTPDELAIYYITNSDDGMKIKEMKVSEQGDSLGTWPEGFFEERHKELY